MEEELHPYDNFTTVEQAGQTAILNKKQGVGRLEETAGGY
jgi:hypothetical protein